MQARRTVGSRVRVKGGLAAMTAVACVIALSVAPAALGAGGSAAKVVESHSKTITLNGRQTKTIDVTYPDALKFSGARYSCTWKINGVEPGKIKILSHGSALGGTVCRVKAHNPALPSLDASVRIKVTATTIRSSSPRSGLG
jgi:hypothetical protein